ncbi:hypothetical protein GCK72_019936 [Caenorhabditis remanei]|uniref:G-protein coupled receptors family 1 profile domain-containing protein n=1 Tax=Caenorhabditis remanei TaxID=31234 RepID=A0A6A5GG46_CAERE|nr:hypothetical protein GCK72_019936 [Caenorhabditis remanei]KAF1753379.1 hypothetical protein GCK72_019936 [Caenorhabditis remanei]
MKLNLQRQLVEIAGFLWRPGPECTGFPKGYSEKKYFLQVGENFSGYISMYTFYVATSQTVVSIIYPFLALLLYVEIRISAVRITDVNHSESLERIRTSRMIMYLTMCYIISSAPRSIIWLIPVFVHIHQWSLLEMIAGYGTIITSTFFCLNATAQCFICFLLSSRYRETARKLLRIRVRPAFLHDPTPLS